MVYVYFRMVNWEFTNSILFYCTNYNNINLTIFRNGNI